MLYVRVPAVSPPAFAEPGAGSRFAADLDLIDTRLGTLAVQRASGAWAYLDGFELELVRGICGRGTTASDAARLHDLSAPAVEAHLARLWRRGLLAADGRWCRSPAELSAQIESWSRSAFSLIMVLSSGCNLGCRYCYLGLEDPASWISMPRETALRAVRWAVSREAAATIVDLGEITAASELWRDLVEEVRELGRRAERPVHVMIQTNGTSLDAAAVEFLRQNRVSVGISLDGPAAVHDRARPLRGGQGSHASVVEALRRLRGEGVPHWVITTVGGHNVDDPEGLLDYLWELRVPDYALKPVLPFGEAVRTAVWQHFGIEPVRYAGFLRRAIRHAVRRSGHGLDLTTRQFLLRALGDARGWARSCTSRRCGCGERRLVLEPDGRLTPCPRFGEYGTEPGAWSPLVTGSPPPITLPGWARTLPPACGSCPWQAHCGGGCALSGREDPHCPSYLATFEALFADVLPAMIERNELSPAGIGPLEVVVQPLDDRPAAPLFRV